MFDRQLGGSDGKGYFAIIVFGGCSEFLVARQCFCELSFFGERDSDLFEHARIVGIKSLEPFPNLHRFIGPLSALVDTP